MKTDKDLDDIFKKGLESPGFSAEFREDDWEALEDLLDKREKKRGIIFWLPLFGGIAATCLLFLGWYFLKPAVGGGSNIAVSQPKTVVKKNSAIAVNSQTGKVDAVSASTNNAGKPTGEVHVNSLVATAAKHSSPSLQNQHPFGKSAAQGINSVSASAKTTFAASGHHRDGNHKIVRSRDEKQIVVNRQEEVLAAVNNENTDMLSASADDKLAISKGVDNISATEADMDNVKAVDAPFYGSLRDPMSRKHPRFALTLIASPDINGVGTFSESKLGTNFGLLFSVNMLKRFKLSTGAVYAYTPYNTEFGNYTTRYKFYTAPQYVSADCRVLDVPVNIDFQVYRKGKNAFGLGTGLSSYFMLSEKYHYVYADPATYGPSGFEVTNRNRYFLGVLNLSASYQRQLNSRFGLALQPYLKIPLTNIGYGQVQLQTAGVAVGISWNIGR